MPQDAAVDRFKRVIEQGEIIFFVGSGVSLSYPACLPSASDLLNCSISRYLPDTAPSDRLTIQTSIWPEVFYQDLISFVGEECLRPFKALTHIGSSSTLAHRLILRTASRWRVPVVTTNFDCLLEEAAVQQKINAAAVLPDGNLHPKGIDVPIWKVHGSIGSRDEPILPRQLLATVSQITQPNFTILRALRSLLQTRYLCFVGYSGRDLDLFPMIREFGDIPTPFWIDPFPSSNLRKRADSIGATLIESTLEELFLQLESIPPSEALCDDASNAREGSQITILRAKVAEELHALSAQGERLTPAQQALLVAICLRRVGESTKALIGLKASPDGMWLGFGSGERALLLNTMARLHDCTSNYRESEQAAKRALRETRWSLSLLRSASMVSLRIQGLHARSMAQKMQLGPAISYGSNLVDFSPSARDSIFVMVKYIAVAVEMRALTSWFHGDSESVRDRVWILQGWHWYFDHLLVLVALMRAFAKRLPKRASHILCRLLVLWLLRILAQATAKGDARILAHTWKELHRFGRPLPIGLQFACDGYDLATDPLNQALIHRNLADTHLAHGEIGHAASEFARSLECADRCGSPATALKALVGLYVCGQIPRSDELSRRIHGLSGSGYERYARQFRALLP